MNWLARLKNIDTAPTAEPTETTKRVSVVFVGPYMAPMAKTGADSPAANDPTPDPDGWAWPHSQAMTSREIDTFTARLHHFTGRGLAEPDAERLADKLVTRDRESDDRRLCVECAHLRQAGGWRCGQWKQAGIGSAAVSADLVQLLQRCDGFKAVTI